MHGPKEEDRLSEKWHRHVRTITEKLVADLQRDKFCPQGCQLQCGFLQIQSTGHARQ